jgi:myosin heavy subunit
VFLRAGQIAILDVRRAEVLDNAARCIQGRFRAFVARKEFLKTKEASISIQAYCRGKHVSLIMLLFYYLSHIQSAIRVQVNICNFVPST